MLTQDTASHTTVVQQLGAWPLCHSPVQGLQEQVLPGDFATHAQGLV